MEKAANKGLIVDVYKHGTTDCTNHGASSKFNEFTLTTFCGKPVNGPFEPKEHRPELVVVPGPFNSLRAVPRDLHESGAWVMFGGNFCYTSDSRFPSHEPIKIFDRVETAEQQRMMD